MIAYENHMVLGRSYSEYLGEEEEPIVEVEEEVEYMCNECGELDNLVLDENDESYVICCTCGNVGKEHKMRYNFFKSCELKNKRHGN